MYHPNTLEDMFLFAKKGGSAPPDPPSGQSPIPPLDLPGAMYYPTKYQAYDYIISKFEQNRTKITAVRVPHTKIQNGRR